MQDDLLRIPCVMMRGGTSKGPFFLASDLPAGQAGSGSCLAGSALQVVVEEVFDDGHDLHGGPLPGSYPAAAMNPRSRRAIARGATTNPPPGT